MRMLRDWGSEQKYVHALKGYNYRMENIQAAVLRVKLRYLKSWTEAQRSRRQEYDKRSINWVFYVQQLPRSATTTYITSTRCGWQIDKLCKTVWPRPE